MFLGLRTAVYYVNDIEQGKQWYASILGFAPYFDEPFYVGFNVAGYELGLQPVEVEAIAHRKRTPQCIGASSHARTR